MNFDRGFWTVTLAHITFAMCFVAVVVQSRLVSFDRSLEEAAMDLGAPPVTTFMKITLPVILPAVVSGWMLAFTLPPAELAPLQAAGWPVQVIGRVTAGQGVQLLDAAGNEVAVSERGYNHFNP